MLQYEPINDIIAKESEICKFKLIKNKKDRRSSR